MTDFLCLKMRLRKNFSTKRGSFGQFLIRIRIQDLDPDPNPGFQSGFESGSDSKLTAGRIRIRNRIRNFCFGSATLMYSYGTVYYISLRYSILGTYVMLHCVTLAIKVWQTRWSRLLYVESGSVTVPTYLC
jgi:hypothetical protein